MSHKIRWGRMEKDGTSASDVHTHIHMKEYKRQHGRQPQPPGTQSLRSGVKATRKVACLSEVLNIGFSKFLPRVPSSGSGRLF